MRALNAQQTDLVEPSDSFASLCTSLTPPMLLYFAGDRQEAAVKVAAAVGIAPSDVHAGIKPAGKAALVEQLKASGRKVAMVGDGINDTAALAAADVGMAMAGGVDAASDVAKVVLMGDQLHQVWPMRISLALTLPMF